MPCHTKTPPPDKKKKRKKNLIDGVFRKKKLSRVERLRQNCEPLIRVAGCVVPVSRPFPKDGARETEDLQDRPFCFFFVFFLAFLGLGSDTGDGGKVLT